MLFISSPSQALISKQSFQHCYDKIKMEKREKGGRVVHNYYFLSLQFCSRILYTTRGRKNGSSQGPIYYSFVINSTTTSRRHVITRLVDNRRLNSLPPLNMRTEWEKCRKLYVSSVIVFYSAPNDLVGVQVYPALPLDIWKQE